jgi:hypothetical protein
MMIRLTDIGVPFGFSVESLVDHLGEHTHFLEVPLGPRNHRIAAELVSWELGFVEQQDPNVLLGQVPGTGCASRPGADDGHVVKGVGHKGGSIEGRSGDQ